MAALAAAEAVQEERLKRFDARCQAGVSSDLELLTTASCSMSRWRFLVNTLERWTTSWGIDRADSVVTHRQ